MAETAGANTFHDISNSGHFTYMQFIADWVTRPKRQREPTDYRQQSHARVDGCVGRPS